MIAWDPERDDTLLCVAVREETHDVRSFVLRAEPERQFSFLPGQFLTLDLPALGQQRCYTIASPPTRPFRLEITVKRSGPVSSWLHDTLRPGQRLAASLPGGEFTCGAQPQGKLLLLGAGSGITPLMSMVRAAHDLGAAADIVLLQSARGAADLIFAGELQSLSARSGFRAASIVEHDRPGARWDGYRGRLSMPMLQAACPDFLERDVFCCGPAPYMAAVRALLHEAGHDRRMYREESFSFAEMAPEPASPSAAPGPAAMNGAVGFEVTFVRSGRTIACPDGMAVLTAARAAGLRLPSACLKGVCGTCKSAVLSGTVTLQHGGGIRQREIDQGLTLLCCARPTSDLVVDR